MDMPTDQVAEGLWRRGGRDTLHIWASPLFYVLDAVVGVVVIGIFGWYWGLGIALFSMLCAWIVATAAAPIKQRNEASDEIKKLEAKLEIPRLFDVLCPTTSLELPINRLDNGSYQASSSLRMGLRPISIIHRGELTTISHITISPEIRFIRADKGSGTINAIQVAPISGDPMSDPRNRGFTWDIQNPYQWELTGLPLIMAKDELITLPIIMVSVTNGNEAGLHFEKGETCNLRIKLAVRTDRGFPTLPDQIISLTMSDIKNSLSELGIQPKPEGGTMQ